jgi:uncharacterized protein
LIEVEVSDVAYNPDQGGYVVVLHDKHSERWLPIFIGSGEAQSIAVNLRANQYPRPMTFDLVSSLIEACGGRVNAIRIPILREGIYYAEIEVIRFDNEKLIIDSRPSDAIPLALRLGIPIMINRDVFETACQGGLPHIDSFEDRILQLEAELQAAVVREDFEVAANIRDQIKYYREAMSNDGEANHEE